MKPTALLRSGHAPLLALGLAGAWLVLLILFTGLASGALGLPFGDATAIASGHLAVAGCVAWLAWRLGWLKASGIAHPGRWQVWLVALPALVYAAATSLYAFHGIAGLELPALLRLLHSPGVALRQLPVAVDEEAMYRGLMLYVLVRARERSSAGLVGSALLVSAVFAFLHLPQVLAGGASPAAALYLFAETLAISLWWSALVLWGGSIWPAALLHFVGNSVVAAYGAATPIVSDSGAYARLLCFNLPLGLLGLGLLLRVAAFPDRTRC